MKFIGKAEVVDTSQQTTFTLTGDGGSDQTIAHGNTLDIAGGNAITTAVGATDTVTINHDDTSSQASVDNSGSTYIQDVTLDTYGHVTGLTSVAIPTLNQNTTGSAATLTTARNIAGVAFDGSANISLNNNAITNGAGYTTNTGDITDVRLFTDDSNNISVASGSAGFTIAGGDGIDTSSSGTTVTIAGELASTSNLGVASFHSDNFNVADGTVTIKDEGVDLTTEVTGVLPSANLDADTAHYSAQRQLTYYMFRADIDTTKTYVGLQEAEGESPTSTNKNLPILAPVAGKLLKVFLRATTDVSGNTFTWRLETQNTSSNTGAAPSVIGTQSGAGCGRKTMTTYDFTTGLDSGTNVIGAGDTVQLSIESDSATANTTYYITCLWEWDLS